MCKGIIIIYEIFNLDADGEILSIKIVEDEHAEDEWSMTQEEKTF